MHGFGQAVTHLNIKEEVVNSRFEFWLI